MSSRSLAAARARRAGDAAPPVSGNRPGTSVGSAAAFSGMPQPPTNVRVARQPPQQFSPQYPPPPPNQYQQQQQQYQQQQQQYQQQNQRQPSAAFQQIQQQQQQSQNGLPFSKLSISDAIGLITLRLGRVEQWVIETEHENEAKESSSNSSSGNASGMDNSVLVGLLNRLEAVEKKEQAAPVTAVVSNDEISKLTAELAALNDRYNKFCDEANKQTLAIAKHTEQLFKFERELVETKDILKTFMIRYDNFVRESNEKLADYEFAIAEIEKSIAPTETGATIEGTPLDAIEDSSIVSSVGTSLTDLVNPDDLKNLVKQEFAGIN